MQVSTMMLAVLSVTFVQVNISNCYWDHTLLFKLLQVTYNSFCKMNSMCWKRWGCNRSIHRKGCVAKIFTSGTKISTVENGVPNTLQNKSVFLNVRSIFNKAEKIRYTSFLETSRLGSVRMTRKKPTSWTNIVANS